MYHKIVIATFRTAYADSLRYYKASRLTQSLAYFYQPFCRLILAENKK